MENEPTLYFNNTRSFMTLGIEESKFQLKYSAEVLEFHGDEIFSKLKEHLDIFPGSEFIAKIHKVDIFGKSKFHEYVFFDEHGEKIST